MTGRAFVSRISGIPRPVVLTVRLVSGLSACSIRRQSTAEQVELGRRLAFVGQDEPTPADGCRSVRLAEPVRRRPGRG